MQYLLTKDELDKVRGEVSPEKRMEIAGEVIDALSLELSPFFVKQTMADPGSFDYERRDIFRVSLEAMRGAFQRVREKFKCKT